MDKKKESTGKGVRSPSGRDGTIANSGGMPPKWDVDKTFTEATPPKRYADDSTAGINNGAKG